MKRNVRKPKEPAGFDYADVEAALAKLYAAEHVQETTFRARLKNFKRLGLPSRRPGKGTRLRYMMASDILQLVVACEFAELGVDPQLIVDIVQQDWKRQGPIRQAIEFVQRFGMDPGDAGDDFYIAVRTNFMSWMWQPAAPTLKETREGIIGLPGRHRTPVQVFPPFKASQAGNFLKKWQAIGAQRFHVFNLSAQVRAIEEALKKSR
jgi:hypothetical protein